MKEPWQKLAARYDAMLLRERWLVALAVLGGIVFVAYSLFIAPAWTRGQLAERNQAEQRVQLANVQAQLAALQAPERHPDVAARAELEDLNGRLGELANRMKALESSLVPPERMASLLEEMIGRRSGLRLLSLKTLPVTPLLEKKNAGAGDAAGAPGKAGAPAASGKAAGQPGGLYKHGVEIRLEGSYHDLAAYLERLEQSKMKLLWGSVDLSAEKHPRLVLTLTVYSLSLDRAWLIV